MRQIVLPNAAAIEDLALAPDGRSIAAAHGSRGLAVYDLHDGRLRFTILGQFRRVEFRADGRWLVGANPVGVVVRNDETDPVGDYLRVEEYVHFGEFPDDDSVAFLSHRAYRRLALPTESGSYGNDYRSALMDESIIAGSPTSFTFQSVGLGPDRRLIGVEYDATFSHQVCLVLDSSGDRVLALLEDPEYRFSMAMNYRRSGDWFAIATNRDLGLYHWSDVAGPEPKRPRRKRGVFEAIRETLVGPSRRAQREDRYGGLPVLRPRWSATAAAPSTSNLPVAFLPGGDAVLCRGERSAIELRDLATGAVRTTWRFGRAWPRALAVAPDGLTAYAATKGGTVVAWDLE